MIYRDFREWLDDLEANGQLLRIKDEIQLEPDVGAMAAANIASNGPGLLAENVAGYQTKLSVCLHASWQRVAMAMGLRPDATTREQGEAWKKAYTRFPIKPRVVSKQDAPCQQNIRRGKDVNLFDLPIPKLNEQDAAPFILKTVCITQDPDSSWINCGTYRMQVLGCNTTSILSSPTAHVFMHYLKARERGKDLEMAVALGCDPSLIMVTSTRIPAGWDELDFAGALRGEPVPVIKGEEVNLPVPATAEIVLEGVLRHDSEVLEGPFGEFTWAYGGYAIMPVFEIRAITHRTDPIFDTVYLGAGRSEGTYITRIPRVIALEQELKRTSPNITQVAFLNPHLSNYVIQGRWKNRTEPRRAILDLFASEAAVQAKMVTVVDEDVDPWDPEHVMWAIAARSQADKDFMLMPGQHCRLDPSVEEDGTSCLLGIDATRSIEPHPRHTVVDWVTPRKETRLWAEKLAKLIQGGRT